MTFGFIAPQGAHDCKADSPTPNEGETNELHYLGAAADTAVVREEEFVGTEVGNRITDGLCCSADLFLRLLTGVRLGGVVVERCRRGGFY